MTSDESAGVPTDKDNGFVRKAAVNLEINLQLGINIAIDTSCKKTKTL